MNVTSVPVSGLAGFLWVTMSLLIVIKDTNLLLLYTDLREKCESVWPQ